MHSANRIAIIVCLCISIVRPMHGISKNTEIQIIERNNTMNETLTSSSWIDHINTTSESGQFTAHDKRGEPVLLEWIKTGLLTPEFAAAMHSISEVGIQAYTAVEMQFLQKHPEVVFQEPYFKAFLPYFEQGSEHVDWNKVEQTMQGILKKHFVFDLAQLPEKVKQAFAHDVCFFIKIKDVATQKALGVITFLVKPEFDYGTVKVTTLAVAPKVQNRGLAKLLMSSIFKILPETQHIFLCTRATNDTALQAYRSWGFVHDLTPTQDQHFTFNLAHWTFMEYMAQKTDTLQKVAVSLIE